MPNVPETRWACRICGNVRLLDDARCPICQLAGSDTSAQAAEEPQQSAANRYAFTLSTLFLLITAIGILCGLWVNFPIAAWIVSLVAGPTLAVYWYRYFMGPYAGKIYFREDQFEEMIDAFVAVIQFYLFTCATIIGMLSVVAVLADIVIHFLR